METSKSKAFVATASRCSGAHTRRQDVQTGSPQGLARYLQVRDCPCHGPCDASGNRNQITGTPGREAPLVALALGFAFARLPGALAVMHWCCAGPSQYQYQCASLVGHRLAGVCAVPGTFGDHHWDMLLSRPASRSTWALRGAARCLGREAGEAARRLQPLRLVRDDARGEAHAGDLALEATHCLRQSCLPLDSHR